MAAEDVLPFVVEKVGGVHARLQPPREVGVGVEAKLDVVPFHPVGFGLCRRHGLARELRKMHRTSEPPQRVFLRKDGGGTPIVLQQLLHSGPADIRLELESQSTYKFGHGLRVWWF